MTQRNQSDKPAGDKPQSRKPAINKPGGSGSITKPKRRSQLSSRALNEEGFGESWVPGTIGMAVNAPNAMDLGPQVVGHVEEEVYIELVPEVLYDIFGEIPAVLKGQLKIRMPSLDTSFPQRPLAEVSSVPFEQASHISSSQPPITHHQNNQLLASSANSSPNPSGAGPWLNKLRLGSGASSHAPGHPSHAPEHAPFHFVGPSNTYDAARAFDPLADTADSHQRLRSNPTSVQQNAASGQSSISVGIGPARKGSGSNTHYLSSVVPASLPTCLDEYAAQVLAYQAGVQFGELQKPDGPEKQ